VKDKRTCELIAASFSPMLADGTINCDCIEGYAVRLLNNGISTVFINGTNGESLSLSLEERRSLAEAWLRAASGAMTVMVHVGHNAIPDAVELARHAGQIGVAAIAAMAPSYFRPSSEEKLVEFFQPIAAAAPNTPFYFYHIPHRSGVSVNVDRFLHSASQCIPNLEGIKYTHNDLVEFGLCQGKWGKRYRFLFGYDELMFHALSLGASGFIGSTFNLIPQTYCRLVDAFFEGDMFSARETSILIGRFVMLMRSQGLLSYGKKLMSVFDVDCGEVRRPLDSVCQDRFQKLLDEIAALPLVDNVSSIGAGSPLPIGSLNQSVSSNAGR